MDWFKHKTTLNNNECFDLKFKKKVAGYGVYMILLELLGDSPDGKLKLDYDLLGARINAGADSSLIKSVINDFGLFKVEDGFFSSPLISEINESVSSLKEKRSLAGKRSGEVRKNKCLTNVEQMFNKCSVNVEHIREDKIREDKIREDKNNISISPSKNDGGECVQPLLLPMSPSTTEAKKEVKTSKQEQLQLNYDFEFWWTLYPKKQGKKEALKAYAKARKTASKETLLQALRDVKAKDWKNRELQYVPHASTWLNQERWNDEVVEAKKIDPLDDLDLDSNPFEVSK